MPRPDQHEFLMDVLKGNEAAVEFVELIGGVTQIIDDLYDYDVDPADVPKVSEQLCWLTLVRLPGNMFYMEHYQWLYPAIRAGVIDWIDANKLQSRKDDKSRHVAYILRSTISSIVVHIAGIVGGDEWMREVSLRIRDHIYEDTFDEFVQSLPPAKVA